MVASWSIQWQRVLNSRQERFAANSPVQAKHTYYFKGAKQIHFFKEETQSRQHNREKEVYKNR